MNLTSICIKNFRNIPSLELNSLAVTTLLAGENGHGKSSVLDAIRMALFGWCEHTATCSKNATGNGAAALIRDGAEQAVVRLTVDGMRVTLTINRKGSDTFEAHRLDTGEAYETRSAMWAALGVQERYALVAAMPAVYLTSTDLGDVLSDLLAGEITEAQLSEVVGACHMVYIKELATLAGIEGGITTARDLQDMGKVAATRFTACNRDLKGVTARREAMDDLLAPKDQAGKTLGADDLPRIQRGVGKVEESLRGLHEELGHAKTARTAADIETDKAAIKGKVTEAEVEKTRLRKVEESTAAFKDAAQKAVDVAESIHRTASSDLKAAEDDAQHAKLRLDECGGDACPACQRKWTAKQRDERTKPREAAHTEALALVDDAKADCVKATNDLGTAECALTNEGDTHGDAQTEFHESVYAFNALRGQLAALEAEAPASRSAEEVQAAITAVSEKLDRGHAIIADLERLAERDALTQQHAALTLDLAKLKWAVKQFRDGAATKQLMGGGLNDFVCRCNAELAYFGDYAMSAPVEGKRINIILACPDKEARPVARCSDGQQMIAQVAVAMAFADHGGLVLLDNINELDYINRAALFARLRKHDGGSVVLAYAWQQKGAQPEEVAKALAPVSLVWLEDGAVSDSKEVTS